MNHVAATILLAQTIIRRRDVEQHNLVWSSHVGQFQQPVSRQVRQSQFDALLGQRAERGRRIVIGANGRVDQFERLVHEPARRIVVAHGEPGAGKPIVWRWLVQQRDRLTHFQPAQITDPDDGWIGPCVSHGSAEHGTNGSRKQRAPTERACCISAGRSIRPRMQHQPHLFFKQRSPPEALNSVLWDEILAICYDGVEQ